MIDAISLPFKLSHEFYISEEALKDELLMPAGINDNLLVLGLNSVPLETEEYYYAVEMIKKYPRISKYDALALAIAKRRNYLLLTGDRALRKAAASEGIEVRGTIWIFDEMLAENVIDEKEYVLLLKKVLAHLGNEIRLPEKEIIYRINKYSDF